MNENRYRCWNYSSSLRKAPQWKIWNGSKRKSPRSSRITIIITAGYQKVYTEGGSQEALRYHYADDKNCRIFQNSEHTTETLLNSVFWIIENVYSFHWGCGLLYSNND